MVRDVGQYHKQIGLFVNQLCHLYYRHSQPEDRMDIRNEVISIVQQRQQEQTHESDSQFLAWVHEIARNVIRNWSRREGTVAKYTSGSLDDPQLEEGLHESLPHTEVSPETLLLERERSQIIQEAIGQLSPIHQQVIWLFYIEELSEAEIAKRIGTRKGTVKSRLHNARKQLAERLTPYLASDWQAI